MKKKNHVDIFKCNIWMNVLAPANESVHTPVLYPPM